VTNFEELLVKTFIPKVDAIERDRKWHVVDVNGKILGRQAAKIARILMGKTKPEYTPFLDCGDFVVVINADKVRLSTPKKELEKTWHWNTLYPGGHRQTTFGKAISANPERIIRGAVWGMLPKGPLGRKMIKKLKVYRGTAHPHSAQKPEALEL
jgi:large subunit ribosomal protein L13